ncbi:MAG: flagellar basal body P-ring protein FlgI [Gemmataceae bacterium]
MKASIPALGFACLLLSGCLHTESALKAEQEAAKEKDLAIRMVGDVTELSRVGPWQVTGVGLVTGLAGTGDAPKGKLRNDLEQQLLKQKAEHVQAMLDDPNNCLVIVTASIHPGAHKGDPLDLEITLPAGSKATSLQGGYLQETVLYNHDTTRHLSPEYSGGDRWIKGHALARAKGRLLVGLANPGEPGEERRGRIWEGGVSLVDRPFYLTLKNDDKSIRIANDVATRINFLFQDDAKKREAVLRNRHLLLLDDVTHKLNGEKRTDMARAVSKERIDVYVPHNYRLDPERYLRVVRLMPLREDPAKSVAYRKRLSEMLLEPHDAVRAALRLEALGTESVAVLRKGLTSPHPIVRFAAAESLLYLDNMAGVDELAKLAEQYPLVRMNALLALGSSEESICKQKLAHMLASPNTPLRCGALWVMRLNRDMMEETPEFRNPYLNTEPIGKAFWLHKPAPEAPSLVQVTVSGRSEVALFGAPVRVQAPLRLSAGSDFIVSVENGDELCTISRISARTGVRREQCSLALEDVLRTMVTLGAGYPEVVDLLRKLDARGGLPCPVAINVLPEPVPLDRLISEGREMGKEGTAATAATAAK